MTSTEVESFYLDNHISQDTELEFFLVGNTTHAGAINIHQQQCPAQDWLSKLENALNDKVCLTLEEANRLYKNIPDTVEKIGNKYPRNAKYAGHRYPVVKLSPELREKYPESVMFTLKGFPDFSPYSYTEIKFEDLTGKHSRDERRANKKSGFSKTMSGYTWHHVEDAKTMSLVPTDIHADVGHTGGAFIIKNRKENKK